LNWTRRHKDIGVSSSEVVSHLVELFVSSPDTPDLGLKHEVKVVGREEAIILDLGIEDLYLQVSRKIKSGHFHTREIILIRLYLVFLCV
jgi:hypothetical protein